MALAVIANNTSDGALVSGIDGLTAATLAVTNPPALVQYVNSKLVQAELALPEGTPVELHIHGWQTVIGESAQTVADQLNQALALGQLRNADGTPVTPWREYPNQIAWGYDAQDLLILRAIKTDIPLPIIILIAGILVGVVIAELWAHWSNPSTPWQAGANGSSAGTSSGTPGSGIPSPETVLSWVARNWPWLILGAGALAAAPWVWRQVARLREAENEYRRAEEGGY